MPQLLTRDFGEVNYQAEEVFAFPLGLPGFPGCGRFLPIRPHLDGALVVLQSLDRVDLAFLTLPVEVLLPGYQLRMVEADRTALGAHENQWRTLVIVSLPADGPATANLLGPLVLNQATRRAVQAIRDDGHYGAAELLEPLLAAEAACS
jgi:flagellar assembly factor FliW